MRPTKQTTIKLYREDTEIFEKRARSGKIAPEHVGCLANLRSAMRAVQSAMGPGYAPLDVILEVVPVAYSKNWLEGCLARLRSPQA